MSALQEYSGLIEKCFRCISVLAAKETKKKGELGQCAVVTVYNVTQQLAVRLALPGVQSVNSLGQVPVFHY